MEPIFTNFDRTLPEPPRHWRKCPLSMTVMAQIMVLGFKMKFESDLPQGARLVRWFMDPYRDAVMFVFAHESFPVVEPGEDIPLGPPLGITVLDEK